MKLLAGMLGMYAAQQATEAQAEAAYNRAKAIRDAEFPLILSFKCGPWKWRTVGSKVLWIR